MIVYGDAATTGALGQTLTISVEETVLRYDKAERERWSPNVAFDLIAAADDAGDGDGDGDVTRAELEATDITGEARYGVGNATDVTDLWAFIDRQASTVGHIDGEGHCAEAVRE